MNCETFFNSKFNSSTMIEDSDRELSKSTLKYYEENLDSLGVFIKRYLKKSGLPECDSDIILSELYISLMTSRDYGDDTNDYNYTIDSFVRNNACMCIKRYISSYSNENCIIDKSQVYLDSEQEDGVDKLSCIKDISKDEDFEYATVDLPKALKSLEYKRYTYGVDIYLLLLFGVIKATLGDKAIIDDACSSLGIDSDSISKARDKIYYDEQFRDCLSGISKGGISLDCIFRLKSYIFFFDDIISLLGIKLA